MKAQDTTVATAAETWQATQPGSEPGTGELLRAMGLRKVFSSGSTQVTALAGVNLSVARGEMVAIVGPSGSGKSTLLHLLGALDTPTSGTVYFAGKSLEAVSDEELSEFRSRAVGFVWQRHHLLPDFTAVENVAMPLLARGIASREALGAAHGWLEEVGLADRAQHRAGELSGGEQQRVAIARALITRPLLLLADEPTGDLDEGNAGTIFELIERLHRSHRLTSILATHNLQLARRCNRTLVLERGLLATGEESLVGRERASTRATSGRATAQEERG
jgi:lipoprotein-releasing system ATP-binding protein